MTLQKFLPVKDSIMKYPLTPLWMSIVKTAVGCLLNGECQPCSNKIINLLLKHNVTAQEHWLCFLCCHSCFKTLGKLLQVSGYLYLTCIPLGVYLLKLFIRVKTFSLALCALFCALKPWSKFGIQALLWFSNSDR